MRQEAVVMFDGKYNQLLDSFVFRTALIVAGFSVWLMLSYGLLST
jgi:hypothetical protein